MWHSDPTAAQAVWKSRGAAVAGINALIFLLTYGPVFRAAHKLTLAEHWLFPLLDGEWEGEITSNWPTIKRMADAASGRGEKFDVHHDDLPANHVSAITKFDATIRSGLFDYEIELRFPENRKSRTVFVRPEWRKPQPPKLSYIYRQANSGRIDKTDAREHVGAAEVIFDKNLNTLTGFYWTNRQSQLGFNTAGVIGLRKK